MKFNPKKTHENQKISQNHLPKRPIDQGLGHPQSPPDNSKDPYLDLKPQKCLLLAAAAFFILPNIMTSKIEANSPEPLRILSESHCEQKCLYCCSKIAGQYQCVDSILKCRWGKANNKQEVYILLAIMFTVLMGIPLFLKIFFILMYKKAIYNRSLVSFVWNILWKIIKIFLIPLGFGKKSRKGQRRAIRIGSHKSKSFHGRNIKMLKQSTLKAMRESGMNPKKRDRELAEEIGLGFSNREEEKLVHGPRGGTGKLSLFELNFDR